MVVETGEKLHVVTRRMFADDLRRHFIGVVDEVSDTTIRATGFGFVFDELKGEFVKSNEMRTRLITPGDAGLIIHIHPEAVDLASLRYGRGKGGARILTDGGGFEMAVSEFGTSR